MGMISGRKVMAHIQLPPVCVPGWLCARGMVQISPVLKCLLLAQTLFTVYRACMRSGTSLARL